MCRLSSRRLVAVCAFVVALVVAIFLGGERSARANGDPKLLWRSLETKHFRISYYSGEEDVARYVGGLAESIYARLSPAMNWQPTERTEIALTDFTDSANGSAGALPYNAVDLNLTAPDDLSPLGDVDDWYLELLTHEYTHVLHTDQIRGVPALINRILGKTLAPNQFQARWLLEGLAVWVESDFTSGGRLRSSQWNMFMRSDVLENNLAPLDVFSNTPRRWPQGNIWYLYGSFFVKWIADTYGEDAIRKIIYDYGEQVIPLAMNRSVRRATGKTYEELYEGWVASMRRQYGAQAALVRARGIREGKRLTFSGQNVQKPRFIPKGAWPGTEGDILYYRDDGHSTAAMYRLPVDRDAQGNLVGARENDRENFVRANVATAVSFQPDGGIVFNGVDVYNNLFSYGDLFQMKAGEKSPRGIEGNRKRLTEGFRAESPDVSPDGRRVVFTTNHHGTTRLQIASLGPDGLSGTRELVPGDRFDQTFAPRWSPDNRHVAYSVWKRGGYRDVRYVDTQDGSYVEVTKDRAIEGGPAFSPDGKWLFFHSDRTGVMNIYAWEIATQRLKQVTNVINGAYQPEISPNGKTLLYVGYTSKGFDLFAMPLDEATWLDALPYVDDRPAMHHIPPPIDTPSVPYNPLHTLRPRKFSLDITPGNFGQAFVVSTSGADIAGMHALTLSMTSESDKPALQGSLGYSYGRLPFDAGMRVFRSLAPRAGFQFGDSYKPTLVEENVGLETSLSYSLPRAYDGQNFAVSYTYSRVATEIAYPIDRINPYDTPAFPRKGMFGALHFGWAYSNVERYMWSVSNEKGFAVSAALDWADSWLASDFSGYALTAHFTTYQQMPWKHHHVLALHAGGGTGGGNMGTRGLYYVGGFLDFPLIDTVRNYLIQGGVVMRGYPVVALVGRNLALLNAEYRFPIVNIDRGPSTLPVFLNRISGAAFVDYGSAFDDPHTAKFKTGVGAELWFDVTLGYVVGLTFRAGHARGLASGGTDQTYFVAAVPF